MVSESMGASALGVRGDDDLGTDGIVEFGVRVVERPGSVVIATVPVVVRLQPASTPTRISTAAAARTRVLICATIGVTES
jgi:hypothetical protein